MHLIYFLDSVRACGIHLRLCVQNVPCCVVRQDSLDIEQFSYKVAVIICKCQGYKFRFCNDYDIEIVDVCPLNGDILAIVFLRINADPPPNKTTAGRRRRGKSLASVYSANV
jgi:hypothetical protein